MPLTALDISLAPVPTPSHFHSSKTRAAQGFPLWRSPQVQNLSICSLQLLHPSPLCSSSCLFTFSSLLLLCSSKPHPLSPAHGFNCPPCLSQHGAISPHLHTVPAFTVCGCFPLKPPKDPFQFSFICVLDTFYNKSKRKDFFGKKIQHWEGQSMSAIQKTKKKSGKKNQKGFLLCRWPYRSHNCKILLVTPHHIKNHRTTAAKESQLSAYAGT